MDVSLANFKASLQVELNAIMDWWMRHATDHTYGGFHGKIDQNNFVDSLAGKGSVLNSRILWAFSAACEHTNEPRYASYADRAYAYFTTYFIDDTFKGVYWLVDYAGRPINTKKQLYAQAFAIYGLVAYYRISGLEEAKTRAIDLFNTIEQHGYDEKHSGYLEAFTQQWQPAEDMRLSDKEANEKKTMNTHLHILEAYTQLYFVWPSPVLKHKIKQLLCNFFDFIIDEKSGHLGLFFDESWHCRSGTISFGHDIEAAWLLYEAAEAIGEPDLIVKAAASAIYMADAAATGLDADGGLWYEYETTTHRLVKEKHWWPQAEAMVGFFNAWQLSGNKKYLQHSLACWNFIQHHILDKHNGEWVWGICKDYSIMEQKDKAGFWKCPYHNSRACMEIIKRIQ